MVGDPKACERHLGVLSGPVHVPGNPSPLPADGIPADLDINPPYLLAHGKHAAAPSASRPSGRCRSSGCHGLDANHAATARRISSATDTPSDSARHRSASAKPGGTRTPNVSPSGGPPPRRSASAFSASQRVPRMVRESRRRGSPGALAISTSTRQVPWSIRVFRPCREVSTCSFPHRLRSSALPGRC